MHEKIKELEQKRLELGITFYRISIDTGINQSSVEKTFKGLTLPKIDMYFKLVEYLNKRENGK